MSEARAAALRRKLGMPLHSEARIRADVSAIPAGGLPQQRAPAAAAATLLRRRFHPGVCHLDGLQWQHPHQRCRFEWPGVRAQTPWLFGTVDADSYQLVRRSWPGPAQTYTRLYGFGIDAYRILPFLSRMRARPTMRVPGVTGDLWMDGDVLLHRKHVVDQVRRRRAQGDR